MKNLILKNILICSISFIVFSLIFFFIPTQLDTMTKMVFVIFNGLGISIPTIVAMRMQLKQTIKLDFDIKEMRKEITKKEITNFVGLLKLQKYIHGDLKKLSEYYINNESEMHGLYREFRDWQDQYNAYITPINMVAEKLIDDYASLLNLLEELDPHIQKIVLSYVFTACEEYLNALPSLGGSFEKDKEVVKLLSRNIKKKWIVLSVGFEEFFKDVQEETYTEFTTLVQKQNKRA
ncbi:hypothetical protein BK749_12830 [Bacillus thuringiensis serovar vazensis]|uniref:Uncharacterized protein n=1 Tax=Bacillus thuringiensis serovar vazensis TaxID=180867 RepID=A0A243CWQ1_BACTU|nr:hypothetical protein [Bacillus thuringiensis]OTY76130.1 hypothetical protein BK749_12830 [Bacillus thuringiensis serovar vazensis]